MGGGGRVGLWGGQGGCERRIEVFVKIQKKNWGWWSGVGLGGGGGQGGCDLRIKVFWENSQIEFFFGVRGDGDGLVGWVRVDVNEE